MESNRQKKVAGIIQEDIAEIIQNAVRFSHQGVLVSVTQVEVTSDLMEGKVYLSVFPSKHQDNLVKEVIEHNHLIRHQLAKRIKHQMRRIPELTFLIDNTLDKIEGIENALNGKEIDPIKHPEILSKRRKI